MKKNLIILLLGLVIMPVLECVEIFEVRSAVRNKGWGENKGRIGTVVDGDRRPAVRNKEWSGDRRSAVREERCPRGCRVTAVRGCPEHDCRCGDKKDCQGAVCPCRVHTRCLEKNAYRKGKEAGRRDARHNSSSRRAADDRY